MNPQLQQNKGRMVSNLSDAVKISLHESLSKIVTFDHLSRCTMDKLFNMSNLFTYKTSTSATLPLSIRSILILKGNPRICTSDASPATSDKQVYSTNIDDYPMLVQAGEKQCCLLGWDQSGTQLLLSMYKDDKKPPEQQIFNVSDHILEKKKQNEESRANLMLKNIHRAASIDSLQSALNTQSKIIIEAAAASRVKLGAKSSNRLLRNDGSKKLRPSINKEFSQLLSTTPLRDQSQSILITKIERTNGSPTRSKYLNAINLSGLSREPSKNIKPKISNSYFTGVLSTLGQKEMPTMTVSPSFNMDAPKNHQLDSSKDDYKLKSGYTKKNANIRKNRSHGVSRRYDSAEKLGKSQTTAAELSSSSFANGKPVFRLYQRSIDRNSSKFYSFKKMESFSNNDKLPDLQFSVLSIIKISPPSDSRSYSTKKRKTAPRSPIKIEMKVKPIVKPEKKMLSLSAQFSDKSKKVPIKDYSVLLQKMDEPINKVKNSIFGCYELPSDIKPEESTNKIEKTTNIPEDKNAQNLEMHDHDKKIRKSLFQKLKIKIKVR